MFSKELGQKLDQYHLLKHPFYQIYWNEGKLTREIIKDYAEQYYQHVKAFPRYISATHSLCEDLDKRKRQFLLMPMMHSEDIKIQEQSLPLFKNYTNDRVYKFAKSHRNIIHRFGRFPHRNKILSRVSTNEEIEFLKQKGSSF